ncbi:MAG: hypothetical protein AB1349_10795 [Elusimicrobiota bacterium]
MTDKKILKNQITAMIEKSNRALEDAKILFEKNREDRENGDYSYEMVIDEEKTKNDIENAEKIVLAVKYYLNKFFMRGTDV